MTDGNLHLLPLIVLSFIMSSEGEIDGIKWKKYLIFHL